MAWSIGRTLGHGSTATVSLASSSTSPQPFAVKSAELSRSDLLRREQSILSSLSSPHIISYLGFDVAAGEYHLFMEYAPGGSLADEILKHGGRLDEPVARAHSYGVLRGLNYLHSVGLAHCDVKGRNVLIGSDGHAKIGDLGCAKWVGDKRDRAIRGTPMFMSPEVARGEEQDTAADIWALGCTVIEMVTGRTPWPDVVDPLAALHRIAFSSDVPEFPSWVSEEARDFLDKCLRRDPRDRWTAEQLLKHPFVADCASKSSSNDDWVSPKSTLDQAFWDSLEDEEVEHAFGDPAERIRELATGSAVTNWTWGENWITVRGQDGMECSIDSEPEDEARNQTPVDETPSEASMIWVGTVGDCSISTTSTRYSEDLVNVEDQMSTEDLSSSPTYCSFINNYYIDDTNIAKLEEGRKGNSFCIFDFDLRDNKQDSLVMLSTFPLAFVPFGSFLLSLPLCFVSCTTSSWIKRGLDPNNMY